MKTGVTRMFVSADPAMQRLAFQANEILAKEGRGFELLPMPLFEDLYGDGGDGALVPMGPVAETKTCIIMHSSGQYTPYTSRLIFAMLTSRQLYRIHRLPEACQIP